MVGSAFFSGHQPYSEGGDIKSRVPSMEVPRMLVAIILTVKLYQLP